MRHKRFSHQDYKMDVTGRRGRACSYKKGREEPELYTYTTIIFASHQHPPHTPTNSAVGRRYPDIPLFLYTRYAAGDEGSDRESEADVP